MWLSPHGDRQEPVGHQYWTLCPGTVSAFIVRSLALWAKTFGHGDQSWLLPFHKPTSLQKVYSSSRSENLSNLLDMYMCQNGTALFAMQFILSDAPPAFFWLMLLFVLYFVLIVFCLIPTFRSSCGQPTKYLKSSQMSSDSFTKLCTLLEHTWTVNDTPLDCWTWPRRRSLFRTFGLT